jgi:hypothetical protein
MYNLVKIDIYLESNNQLNLYKPIPFTLYIRHFPFIFEFNKPDMHFLTHWQFVWYHANNQTSN